jgi:hypothetical protein
MNKTTSHFIGQIRALADALEKVNSESTTEKEYYANRYPVLAQFGMVGELSDLEFG